MGDRQTQWWSDSTMNVDGAVLEGGQDNPHSLQEFTDVHPEFETPVERLATWLARLDDPEDD